jgi:hypothetical protein
MESNTDSNTDSNEFTRWSGAAAVAGGALWSLAAVLHSLKPRGCIADECQTRSMRESGAVDGILTLSSMLLILAGAAGLVLLVRRAGRFGRAGRTGVVLAAAGFAVLLAASVVQALAFGGDFPLMPYFVIPGLLAAVTGFLLVGVTVLRAGVLPRWAAALLIAGAALMLVANEQTILVLLLIPFGVAWMVVGYLMWSEPARLEPGRPQSGTPAPA